MDGELSNTELLSRISQILEQQTDMLRLEMQAQTEKTQKQMQTNVNLLYEQMRQLEARINIKMENEVTKRIDSLFDGYKLNHEKQWDLERKVETLERRIDSIENRIA